MKKVISFLLVCTLVLSMVPMMAVSADTVLDENYYSYTVENGEATITGVDGIYIENTDGYIPAFLGGYPVTKIKKLDGAHSFTAVYVPEGVREIADLALSQCSNAVTIHIPSTVEYIGTNAVFPVWNAQLESITVAEGNAHYTSVDGVLFTKDKKTLLRCPVNKTGAFTIPNGVKTIAEEAFFYCNKLTSVSIPSGVTEIKDFAFRECSSLTSVTLPDTVTEMGNYLFDLCTSLKTATLPKGATWITHGMFNGCKELTKVNYGMSVVEIGSEAFKDCAKLTSVLLNVDEYGFILPYTFAGCTALKTVLYGRDADTRKTLAIEEGNGALTKAKWIYNYCPSGKGHSFAKPCSSSCGRCGMPQNPRHAYKLTAVKKATLSKDGTAKGNCVYCGKAMNTLKPYVTSKAKTVKLATTTYAYNGKAKKPAVIIKDAKGNTIPLAYYTVKYASGRKNVGKYKVTVTFKGLYSGSKTLYFTVNPAMTSVKSLSAAKKSLKVTLNKKTFQTTGYQIQYATSSKFKSAKTKTVSNKTTKVTLKGLKAKKTYYVRVRTYKTVNGKKYYSTWSGSKKKQTK